MKNEISIKDVAKKAGVSISTVSRALSKNDYINEDTRKKILGIIEELDYHPNITARLLKSGKSNTIAVTIPSINNLIYPVLVRGIQDEASKNGYIVEICNTDENSEIENGFLCNLKNKNIAGLISASFRKNNSTLNKLQEEGFPIVLAIRSSSKNFDTVMIDNKKAASVIVQHLIDNGAKKISIATGDKTLPIYQQRFKGYKEALNKASIEYDKELVIQENGDTDNLYNLTQTFIKQNPTVDAIFATTDFRAIIIIKALKDMGKRIPQDIAVVGFDDVEISRYIDPPLTTIHQPLYDIGIQAAQRLIEQIKHKAKTGVLDKPKTKILEAELIIRRSGR